jgi:GT2 family glycosyltransferase
MVRKTKDEQVEASYLAAMRKSPAKVLVVIVTYNAMQWAEQCFASLQKSSVRVDVIVVDNGSTDGTKAYIREHFKDVHLIEMTDNRGFGQGNNLGLKYALENNYDHVMLLNQDAWLTENALSTLLSILKSDARIGIACPVQLNGDGTDIDQNFKTYMKANTLAELRECVPRIETTGFANAAAWLIPLSVIRKVGGFDPIFSHYGEDRDYSNRAAYHGYTTVIGLDALVIHDRRYSSDNPYRKVYNRTLTMGLAHLKNINHSLLRNLMTWQIWRLRKIASALFTLNWEVLFVELKVTFELIGTLNVLAEVRFVSKNGKTPFIE